MLQSSWSTNLAQITSEGATSKTNSFFASAFEPPMTSPNLPKTPDVTKARSLNVDFFAVDSPGSRPAPPASIHASPLSRNSSLSSSGSTSSESSSSQSSHILARLFPSRYRSVDEAAHSRKLLELENITDQPVTDDPALQDTPRLSFVEHATPKPLPITPRAGATLATHLSTSPTDINSVDRLTVSTSLSLRMDSLPTPSPSRTGSMYNATIREYDRTLPRETLPDSPIASLQPGSIISSEGDSTHLTLVRTLGQGSFSSVWLGQDDTGSLEKLVISRKSSIKRQQIDGAGIVRRKSSKRLRSKMAGTKPWKDSESRSTMKDHSTLARSDSVYQAPTEGGRLVAVKLTERALCEINDRTRVSFIREVEVLRHLSHPSIVSFIHSFTSSAYHCLVLEHIDGEELFDLINSDDKYTRMDEPTLRRIWGELCKAVGWLHEVALVHRDIKLENIMLTRDLRSPPSSAPLLKLTDFGLSRFVDPDSPLLSTRCGSESYAAPEIITGRKYDGRGTDAWACGVVLYALATRKLPFETTGSGFGRKAMLMRIAKCEYTWPNDGSPGLSRSEGLRRVVGRLLVRDPLKRSQIKHLWNEEWMLGEGAPIPPPPSTPPLPPVADPEEEDIFDEDDIIDDDGYIVDGESIANIARQELL